MSESGDYYDTYAGASVSALGFDAWCNLPGQYTYFTTVGYLGALRVCDLGVFGTVFIRDEPLYETIEVRAQDITEIEIPHIYPEVPITNVLAISLRE